MRLGNRSTNFLHQFIFTLGTLILTVGEFEFCEKYKDEEACEAICGSESSLFCSEAYEETQKLQQKIEKLKDLTAKHDKVALEAVRYIAHTCLIHKNISIKHYS